MLTCGIWFKNWILDSTYESTWKTSCTLEIVNVLWNRTTTLTQRDNPDRVNKLSGSWHWDKTYL